MHALEGLAALITGGGSGIGRAAAQLFAEEGASVAVIDVNPRSAAAVRDEILAEGGTAIALQCDVSDEDEVRRVVDEVKGHFGPLHVAFNNAGVAPPIGSISELSGAAWDRAMSVNLRGIWHCMKSELAIMPAGGSIVNTSSVAGLVGDAGSAVYSATKHGIVGLTKSAAAEYGPVGIRVNAIAPGLTRTAMVERLATAENLDTSAMLAATPLRRMAEPREIAEAALWLASSRASFVTGHVLSVDGGQTAI
jgi:NAD(P)-dependent dehydrogenase (short-subunit alcohol dehydrogenase family)